MAEAEVEQKGKSRLPLLVGLALGVLLLGGGGAWFWLQRSAATSPGEDPHGDAAVAEVVAPLSERLLSLEPFVVNLGGGKLDRFLKARIELETHSPLERDELQTRSAQIRDAIIVTLSSKRVEDLGSFEGKVLLKTEIAQRLGDLLGEDRIQSVLITEFVIQ